MKELARCATAGGLGTFGLVFAGTGVVVANDLSAGAVTHVGVSIVFGAIVMAGACERFAPLTGIMGAGRLPQIRWDGQREAGGEP